MSRRLSRAELRALPLFERSARIGAHARAMGENLRRAEATGEPRIARPRPPLVPERPLPVKLGPDPAGEMSRLKPDVSRPVERPHAVDEQLTIRTPQFFLRNTMRLERYADPDWIETHRRTVRETAHWDDARAAARCGSERLDLDVDTASTVLDMHLAERRVVMVESRWQEVFGRPDPVE